MKERRDLVFGWLRKAQSDLVALDASAAAGAYDAASFHAQQAAEKTLKAYLANAGTNFPFTHNLSRLVDLCTALDSSFVSLLPVVEPLTPFAVELRYDADFWPSEQDTQDARSLALDVWHFVLRRLPQEVVEGLNSTSGN